MPKALKGEVEGYVSPNYLGRPANTIPRIGGHGLSVEEITQRNLQERRKYNKGEMSIWGQKYDDQGKHTNKPYWDQNK